MTIRKKLRIGRKSEQQSPSLNLIAGIEHNNGRQPPSPNLIAKFEAKHNKQEACPLFIQVPPEIRNTIFIYALISYEDLSVAYPNDAHYSRPDYRYAIRIDTRLLRTCRLIYLETRFLPVEAHEHTFWCRRAPPGITYAEEPVQYFKRFTEEQKERVDRVHFFTQQFYLENNFFSVCLQPDFQMRSLKMTLRHGDWWWWESNNPLRLRDGWSNGLKYIKRLEEVILELETIERDREQIYAIAERVRKEFYPLNDGRILSTLGNPLIKREWLGPSRLPGQTYNKSQNTWLPRNLGLEKGVPDPGLKYCIIEIRWTARRRDEIA